MSQTVVKKQGQMSLLFLARIVWKAKACDTAARDLMQFAVTEKK
jgi:hypothetical protein